MIGIYHGGQLEVVVLETFKMEALFRLQTKFISKSNLYKVAV